VDTLRNKDVAVKKKIFVMKNLNPWGDNYGNSFARVINLVT
jgi:hypothetical protein